MNEEPKSGSGEDPTLVVQAGSLSGQAASQDEPAPIEPAATDPAAEEAAPTAPAMAEPSAFDGVSSATAERPEVAVGAAFAGGFLLALILKRLAR